MVLLDPPAPAAREEVGLGAVGARRLGIMRKVMMSFHIQKLCRKWCIPDGIGSWRSGYS